MIFFSILAAFVSGRPDREQDKESERYRKA